jgi:DsbC/DsbD-like thiol-disulfide interchange protein
MRPFALFAALALLAGSATPPRVVAQFDMDAPGKPKTYILYAAEPQTVPAGRHAQLELRFQVVPGYHVNSHTPKSPYLIPTVLTLQAASGVKTDALQYPAGKPYSFAFDPTDKLDVYAGDFSIGLPVVAAPGDHTLDGTLRYQACDNASCYPPRTLPVRILFTAK